MPYRTKANTDNEDGTKVVNADISALAIPTLNAYENAISLYQGGKAYLYPVVSTQGVRFENGEMFFEDDALRSLTTAERKLQLRGARGKEQRERKFPKAKIP